MSMLKEPRLFQSFANKMRLRVISFADPESGSITTVPSGLTTGGRHLEVTVSNTAWTKLPDVASLTARNQINIQNNSNFEMKINHTIGGVAPTVGYVGMVLSSGNERLYQITEGIEIYGRIEVAAGASQTIDIEELA